MRERPVGKPKNLVWWLHLGAALVLASTAIGGSRLDGQASAPATQQAVARVDYRRDVQPIVNANCVSCHNGPTAPAELQLATPDGLLRGGTSGRAVIAGDAAKSLLVIRIEDRGPNRMPPNGQLTSAELATIRAWIDQGAVIDASVDFERRSSRFCAPPAFPATAAASPEGNSLSTTGKRR